MLATACRTHHPRGSGTEGFKSMTGLELVEVVAWYASRAGLRLTPIRLVKFLYLADLYNARRKGGKTITGWPWIFHSYGPFCVESLKTIEIAEKNGILSFEEYPSKFRDEPARLYFFPNEREFNVDKATAELSIYVTSSLKHAIKRFGLDTYALLDHVYFDTEPMHSVRPGDTLDFLTATEPVREGAPKPQALSKAKLAAARAALETLVKRTHDQEQSSYVPPAALFDADYERGMKAFDEDELTPVGETAGIATLEGPSDENDEG